MAQGPEGRLQKRIREALTKRFPSSYWVKNHGSLYSGKGRPDLEGCCEGIFFGFEVKVPGKEKSLTAIQAHTLNKIQGAGGVGEMITSKEQAIEIVERVLAGNYNPLPYAHRKVTKR